MVTGLVLTHQRYAPVQSFVHGPRAVVMACRAAISKYRWAHARVLLLIDTALILGQESVGSARKPRSKAADRSVRPTRLPASPSPETDCSPVLRRSWSAGRGRGSPPCHLAS